MMTEVQDIRKKHGDKYDAAIAWMLLYAACMGYIGSMPFCVELDNLKDTDAPIHQPAAMLVAAD
jgi:hypothetical protein